MKEQKMILDRSKLQKDKKAYSLYKDGSDDKDYHRQGVLSGKKREDQTKTNFLFLDTLYDPILNAKINLLYTFFFREAILRFLDTILSFKIRENS